MVKIGPPTWTRASKKIKCIYDKFKNRIFKGAFRQHTTRVTYAKANIFTKLLVISYIV